MNKAFVVAIPEEVNNSKEINGIPVFYSGLGKLNAMSTTSKLISEGFNEIINIGSCGSTNLKPGEIIKIGKCFEDIDATPIFEYGKTSNDELGFIEIDKNSEFSCFTTDYFFYHNEISKYSQNYIKMVNECSVLDMECYSHAKICKLYDVKFSSYKWVSDDGDYNSWVENCKIGFNNFLDNFTITL